MAHFEDCKFSLRDSCLYGPNCFFRHNELACLTVEVCTRWASGYVCDGRCNLRHPSVTELAEIHQLNSTPKESNTSKITPTSVSAVAPLCVFFQQGRCSKGSTCPFNHAAVAIGENGSRPSVDNPKVPPPGGRQRSATIAEGARPREATASAPVCMFFAKGRCTKGSSCPFSHDSADQQPQHQLTSTPVEENTAKITSTSVTAAAPLCEFFQQGRCSKGPTCPFSHAAVAIGEDGPRLSVDEPKVPPPGGRQRSAAVAEGAQTREATASAPVCMFFTKGRCTKGSSCLFSHETPPPKEQSADVKAKAAEILERHRLSKRLRVEAGRPKTSDASPKRQPSPQGSVAASSAGRGAAGVSPDNVDRPGRTKQQRSPQGSVAASSGGKGTAGVSMDRPGRTKRQRSPEQSFSTACAEGERATKASRSEIASGMNGQGDVATSATTSSPTLSPPSPHTAPPATIST